MQTYSVRQSPGDYTELTSNWQRPWSSKGKEHMQIALTTQKRASNKLVAERRDKDNDLGATVDVKWSMSQWSTVTANQTLGCFRRGRVASRLRKALIPLCSALVRLPWHAASSAGPPSLTGMWRNWRESWESYRDEQEPRACALQGGTEGAGISLVKKSVRSNTVGAYVYLKRRCKDAWPKLLSLSADGIIRGRSHRLWLGGLD